MTYLDPEPLKRLIATDPEYRDFLGRIRLETEEYFRGFADSPSSMSRWAHHYFCEKEGGLLLYNEKTPDSHICSLCGKEYSSSLLKGVWFTMYRNQGVLNAWKSALVYRLTGETESLDRVVRYAEFYNDRYLRFRLHNKEGLEADSPEDAPWGCARIMPQALNESIFLIRLINALEMVKESLPAGFLGRLKQGIFREAFRLFRPQVDKIHNIPAWLNCGIGVMGLFLSHQEMIDFAFKGKWGILEQLSRGVTPDSFWYEGSIHYNFFLLEGVVNLLLFAELKGQEFSLGKEVVERMLAAAYRYAFDNHQLPNPNDGWPDVNLKTYSHIYAMAVKVLGEEGETGRILGAILNRPGERGTVPLSKPYYFRNRLSLEEVLFAPGLRRRKQDVPSGGSVNFKRSFCANLKAHGSNMFIKYGHNGPSHAHPDKMNLEVVLKGIPLSRDLSNAGYGNPYCNEWHRVTASHNTVVVNGQSQTGFGGGACLAEGPGRVKVRAAEVYPGAEFTREIMILPEGFEDVFDVSLEEESLCDYLFHLEGAVLVSAPETEKAGLGFRGSGYQYFRDIEKVLSPPRVLTLCWKVRGQDVISRIDLEDTALFLMKSPDNPVAAYRTTLLLRQKGRSAHFHVTWMIPGEDHSRHRQ